MARLISEPLLADVVSTPISVTPISNRELANSQCGSRHVRDECCSCVRTDRLELYFHVANPALGLWSIRSSFPERVIVGPFNRDGDDRRPVDV